MIDFSILIDELINALKSDVSEFKVVSLPHFCIDNIAMFEGDHKSFTDKIGDIAGQGGGNIIVSQGLQLGGKAANTASALASLGIKTYLIARTDRLGYKLLGHLLNDTGVDLSYVRTDGELALTTSIELTDANIMLSYPASLSNFGPDCLSDSDWKLLSNVDLVAVSDWGLNERGTELAREVFNFIKKNGRGKTFFDPGDPSPKGERERKEIAGIKDIIEDGLVNILSVNEDEIERYGGVEFLRRYTRVDFHTKNYAISYYGDLETECIPTFDVKPHRLTGAGDVWNAGDIFGEFLGLSDNLRLLLANALSALYISYPSGKHPNIDDLRLFLNNKVLRNNIF
ncbi:MAG: carbohydrate kinase family protein [bacterium]